MRLAPIFRRLLATTVILQLNIGVSTNGGSVDAQRVRNSLHISTFTVPKYVVRGGSTYIDCQWQESARGQGLYALKWYHGNRDFYRWYPVHEPHVQVFSVPHSSFTVDLANSSKGSLRLTEVLSDATLTCEIIGEAPTFRFDKQSADMTVVACPAGTYEDTKEQGDLSSCTSCPDPLMTSAPGSSSEAQCNCPRNYRKQGNSCQVITCLYLENPPNGEMVDGPCNTQFGASCRFACSPGYVLRSSTPRRCLISGTWSGDDTICEACPAGTYEDTKEQGDLSCTSCPDPLMTSAPGSSSEAQCSCPPDYTKLGNSCQEWVTVVVAGLTDYGATHDVEVFSDKSPLTLPNYPKHRNDISMTARGSKLYGCGGCGDTFTCRHYDCYMLDLNSKDRQWQKSYKSPYTFGSGIIRAISGANGVLMMLYSSGKISVNYFNDSETTKLYDTFHKLSDPVCSANNETHTFVIANESVYMFGNSSNPHDWQEVAKVSLLKYRSCLLFGSELFITGGREGFNVSEQAYAMDVNTFIMTEIGSPNVPRYAHGMGIIDGRPAMIGGRSRPANALNSIETYDHQTDSWQTLNTTLQEPRFQFGSISLMTRI